MFCQKMMKKILSLLSVAALMISMAAFAGCGAQETASEATTEEIATTQASLEDDLALPQDNDTGTTAAQLVALTQATTKEFKEAPIMQAIMGGQNAAPVTTTTTTQPAEPEPDEPEQPGEETPDEPEQPAETTTAAPTTTQPVATAEMLNKYVLSYINSGTYTETISAFGKDQSPKDQIKKIVRNGQTAYFVTIPDVNLGFKAYQSNGTHYLVTATQYCEMTKAQFDSLANTLNNMFCNFAALQYQKTETVRDGLKTSTCEHFEMGGTTVTLWFQNKALTKLSIGSDSLPMTITGSADSAYFSMADGLQQVEYESLKALVDVISMF